MELGARGEDPAGGRSPFAGFEGEGEARFLVRLAAEVASKSNRTRRRFHKQLVANLKDALTSSGARATVSDRWSRLFVAVPTADAMSAATRVFGVSSFSRVDAVVPADLETIVQVGHEAYREAVTGRRYAVAARRTGRQSFSSQDIRVRLGAALNPYGAVDLTAPEVTVSVEVRDDRAYLFAGRTEGPGGLPLGVQGRAVCLISGGFDSAVAAWLLLKRGVALDYVFCNLGGPAFERSVVQVARILADRWSYGDRPRMHVVDFGAAVQALQLRVAPRYWQVVLKRLMYRAAERVGAEVGADALITGESVGQVSSQTLRNLRAIEAASTLPVLRPLVGFDKEEIIRIAKRIGTAALSARVREYCAILEGKPVTAARAVAVDREEAPLDPALVDRAVAERRVLDVRGVEDADLNRDYLWTDEVPEDARVVDCRPGSQDDGWRLPGSRRVLPSDFPALAGSLIKSRRYVLFCDNGAQSGQLASVLQTAGFEAYALRGGTRELRRGVGSASSTGPGKSEPRSQRRSPT